MSEADLVSSVIPVDSYYFKAKVNFLVSNITFSSPLSQTVSSAIFKGKTIICRSHSRNASHQLRTIRKKRMNTVDPVLSFQLSA